VLAYGAFGLFLKSIDEGRRWTRQDVIEEGFDRHIAKVIALGDALVLVGESGTIARSTDGGATWTRIESPYEGSFFGGLRTADGSVLIFGMRGNVFRSTDAGRTWRKVETGTKVAFNGGRAFDDGMVVLAGNSGKLALSRDNGQTFEVKALPGRGYASVLKRSDGELLVVGDRGITLVPAALLAK
jgi:photosystem II stability/assembly factor-like uncharacterized protein